MPPDADRLRFTTLQYETVRAESNQTRQDQQSILNWNQALAIALFAAGFVATGQDGNVLIGRMLYGAVLPAVLLGGALAWAGEMVRMERTGAYLRALERSMWDWTDDGEAVQTNWFVWENILWSPPDGWHASGFRKQSFGYAGIAIFYAVMYISSLISFMSLSPWWLSLIDATILVTGQVPVDRGAITRRWVSMGGPRRA